MSHFVSFGEALCGSIEAANDAYQSEQPMSGIATGLMTLDHALGGLRPSELIVIAARPSMGKSALAANIAFNVARRRARSLSERTDLNAGDPTHKGAVVGYFSLETKAKQLADRMLANGSGVPYSRIRNGMIDEAQFKHLIEASQQVASIPLYIDDTAGIAITDLIDRARKLKRERGVGLLIVDYIQLIEGGERQGEGRFQEISEITARLKTMAMTMNLPVVAISQLSRQPESRDDRRPILTDLLSSGSIEHDADVVLFLYREQLYLERAKPPEGTIEFHDWMMRMQRFANSAEVIIAKHRHGPVRALHLAFDQQIGRFSDAARDAP